MRLVDKGGAERIGRGSRSPCGGGPRPLVGRRIAVWRAGDRRWMLRSLPKVGLPVPFHRFAAASPSPLGAPLTRNLPRRGVDGGACVRYRWKRAASQSRLLHPVSSLDASPPLQDETTCETATSGRDGRDRLGLTVARQRIDSGERPAQSAA